MVYSGIGSLRSKNIQNMSDAVHAVVEKKNGLTLDSLESLGRELWDNEESVKILVEEYGYKAFQHATERLRNSSELARISLKKDGFHHPNSLQYLGPKLQDDAEFMKHLIEQYGYKAFQYASPALKDLFDIAEAAIKKDGKRHSESLQHLGNGLRDNESFMKHAVKQYGHRAFQYASERLRNSTEFARLSIEKDGGHNPESLKHLGTDLQNNPDFMKYLVKQYGFYAFKCASEGVRNQEAVAYAAIKKDGGHKPDSLKYLGKDLRNNIDFMKSLIEQYGFYAFQYGSETIRNSSELARIAVKKDGGHSPESLNHLGLALLDNPEFMKPLCEQYGHFAFEHASESIRNRADIASAAIKKDGGHNPISLKYLGVELQDNAGFMKTLSMQYGNLAFKYASERVRNLVDVANAAIERDGVFGFNSLQYIGFKLQDNEEFMARWISRYDVRAFNVASDRVKNSPRILAIMADYEKRLAEILERTRKSDPSG
ncbi:MAG: DUF4116 domain-containing protein [Chlamydia sp.]